MTLCCLFISQNIEYVLLKEAFQSILGILEQEKMGFRKPQTEM